MELYKEIKRTARTLARRVVFITGDVLATDTRKFLSRVKAPYISKPFDAEKLTKEINRILAEGI
jgi:CheY-like chemotaxis protein